MDFSISNTSLNELFSKEIEEEGIISIWGDVGVGKSTLCFSAALSTLSKNKKVIYISTKSFFKLERFNQMKNYYPDFDIFNFILYNPKNFNQQTKIVMDLEFLILKEKNLLGKTNVGLIILDTATTLKQISMNKEEINQKLQTIINAQLASLDDILKKYKIPIIVTNRSTIKFSESTEDVNEKQSSAKSINHWTKTSLKIERTSKTGVRKLIIEKHPQIDKKEYKTKLTDKGFE